MLSITLEDLVKRPILTAFVTISSLWLLTFTVKLILWRLHFRRLQAQGLVSLQISNLAVHTFANRR